MCGLDLRGGGKSGDMQMNFETKPSVMAELPSDFLGKLMTGMAKKAAMKERGSCVC